MSKLAILTAAALVSLASSPALAWNDQGHMMVAAIAYDQLKPKVKQRVGQLLALNKYPTKGKDNASPEDHAKAVFMMAATAPDAIKDKTAHPEYINDGEDPTKSPASSLNEGFEDMNMHKYWHYIDIPFSPDNTPLVQPPTVNVRERIGVFRKTLASNASDDLKAYDLVWLLHLVGDIHQPLHATSRFTQADDPKQGDIGGNSVKLCASPCRDELHAFWDDVLGKNETVSAALKAAATLPEPKAKDAAISDEATWANESFEAAQKWVYAPPIGVGDGPFTLNASYKADAKTEAQKRVALAGARLAKLLNNELK